MGVHSGISVAGYQDLAVDSAYPLRLWNLKFSATPLLPPSRVGYLYVLTYDSAVPSTLYIVDSLAIYRPGVFKSVGVPSPTSAWNLKLYAFWNVAGLNWTASVA